MQPAVLLMGNEADSLRRLEAPIQDLGCDTQIYLLSEQSGRNPVPRPDLIVIDLTTGISMDVARHVIREQIGEVSGATLAVLTLEHLADFDPRGGFDGFIVWPGQPLELQARVRKALATEDGIDPTNLVRVADLVIDKASFRAYLAGEPLTLTFKEYELLLFLATNRDRVLSREAILNRVWGYDYYGGARTVDVHIRRLRTKIEDRHHSFIETVRNVGYRFHVE
jgi:two-component system alkaline phosphatase synthesis response regulator PhoP